MCQCMDMQFQNTPKPWANHVNVKTVTRPVTAMKPRACLSVWDSAPLQVAHLNSVNGKN